MWGEVSLSYGTVSLDRNLRPRHTIATEIQGLYDRASGYDEQAQDAQEELDSEDPEMIWTLTPEGLRTHQEHMALLAREVASSETMRDQLETQARLLEEAQALGMTDEEWRAHYLDGM